MSATFSWETQELLDRADRAIEHSIEAREDCARGLAEARRWMLHVELALYGDRAETIRQGDGARGDRARYCSRKISRSKVGEDNGIDLAAKRKEKGSCNLI